MCDTPKSLQSICFKFIASNIENLCEAIPKENESSELNGSALMNDSLAFKNKNLYLHTKLSEELLSVFVQIGMLDDRLLSLFSSNNTRLERVNLENSKNLSLKGLKTLQQHSIVNLEASHLSITIGDLVNSLNEWTLTNSLRIFNVNNCSFLDTSSNVVVVSLSKLKNLRELNVSYTEFNNHGLQIIAEDLHHLECIDISETRVSEISPLLNCRQRLRTLIMHNLKITDSQIPIICDLNRLVRLDVSRNSDFSSRFHQQVFVLFDHITPPQSLTINELLCQQEALLELKHLDISGCEGIDVNQLIQFIRRRPPLHFLGLLDCEACYDNIFTESLASLRNTLKVSGSANENQILEALTRYPKRIRSTQKSLYELFSLTQLFSEPRVDVIQLVLRAMRAFPEEFHIQMAATACIYNLTKGEVGQKIHPHILREIVDCTLCAMESFPNNLQLQKNTLLTLCSDRILQDVTFDRFRCARLVLDCLCTYDDSSIGRMSVAICSILASKISTSETTVLGSTPKYMRKLLSIVKTKTETNVVDITMRFTLSALWNLTDESPQTSSIFLKEGGMELYLKTLQTFPGETSVETKVLGLINNIAEVNTLRHRLMVDDFLLVLYRLLRSPLIDVAYFACGIVAHLASAGSELWATTLAMPLPTMLEELGAVVVEWSSPESEMVCYRKFAPFFHLIMSSFPQVQLWALWAINHVCSRNAKRYCAMLYEEEGDEILSLVEKNVNIPTANRQLVNSIMDLLKTQGLERETKFNPI